MVSKKQIQIKRFFEKIKSKICIKIFRKDRVDQKKLNEFTNQNLCYASSARDYIKSDVAIIVPCYNHSRYLPLAFESIVNQTILPKQVIFVDDHSDDDTYVTIKKLIQNNSDVNINFSMINNTSNVGQSRSLNKGISMAKTEIIMILNDDDYLMHDAIEKILSVFDAEKELYLIGAKSVYVYNDEYLLNHKKNILDSLYSESFHVRKSFPSDVLRYETGREIDMCHSSCSFFKIAWEAVGGYYHNKKKRIIFYTDRDFQLRVNSLFPIGVIDDAAFAFWRINSSVDGGIYT